MKDWEGYQFIVFSWLMLAIAFFLLLNRLFVQSRHLRAKTNLFREGFVICAFLCFLGGAVIHTYKNGRHVYQKSSEAFYSLTEEDVVIVMKLIFVEAFLYLPGIYFCKLDLLLLYHDLAPRHLHPKIFWLVVVTWFFTVIGFLVQVFYLFFACIPFEKNWAIPMDACGITDEYYYSVWSTHILSDLFVYITPIIIITRMKKLTLSRKIGAASMFIIGFINIFTALFIMISQAVNHGISWAWYGANTFMQTVQFATAIWVVCFPHLGSTWRLVRGDKAGIQAAAAVIVKDVEEKGRRNKRNDIESILVTTGLHTSSVLYEDGDEGSSRGEVEQVKSKESLPAKDPEVSEIAISGGARSPVGSSH